MSLFLWMILGALAGWLASLMLRDSSYGQMPEIMLGIVGGIAGGIATGWLLGMNTASGFNAETMVGAVAVALVSITASRIYRRSQVNR
jgi:uncharacterized membrane protein YeaQ/YmgE (transglycosylase-associated protein family)